MDLRDVKLSDRYDIDRSPVLLSGTQALVRATLMQRARDVVAGHNTAGYVTGYRGSPLGAVDSTFQSATKWTEPAHVKFHPGLNEDLAATAIWGAQQAELRGEGKYDGVFSLWYGKGPGVDRSGDVFRHANVAGSSPLGGVIVAMGDDHTGESSTTLHQSELALMDAMMPILSPAGVQELLDFAITGWAMSRYSGLWVGLKCMKDTVEATAVVDGDPHRVQIQFPTDFEMPEGGLNIPVYEEPFQGEDRIHDHKRFAAQAFARANRLDRRTLGAPGARVGVVAAGKSWLDVVHAMDLLGIGEDEAERMGLSVYKVGMVWPLEPQRLSEWADGLDLIIVAEEKRAVIETQLKEILYHMPNRPRVVGWKDEHGAVLFSVKKGLDPVTIALGIGAKLEAEGCGTDSMRHAMAALTDASRTDNTPDAATRTPWFCAGCPHNSSTKIPEGSRAYAGIGCHYMVQWMDRDTLGYTHMGGEGANWIGEAPFSTRSHVFQNVGDGTYNHSGIQSIRAAVAAGDVNITFKVLYNDAVAMTGGQGHDGDITADRIARELLGIGVKRLVAVVDEKEMGWVEFPREVAVFPRSELLRVERELRDVPGVTAMIYVQTCAAEKRRRRKRGKFPNPTERVFINPNVCEGCGDCGVQSNCVAILPKETPLGRKREIDQSACNKDFSCLKGFCPSFVTVEGAEPKKKATASFQVPELPEPTLPALNGPYNVLVTGVGGTGVVTVGALLSMAAHLEGKGAAEMQMAGLAQKGGAVAIHCRVAPRPEDISAVRISVGEADAVIGGDLVVTGGQKALALMQRGRTGMICNSHEIITGAFTRDTEFQLPTDSLRLSVERKLGEEAVTMVEANRLAEEMLGDSIYSNVLLLGAAWQRGLLPVSRDAILKAIELNGAGVDGNKQSFEIGRWAVAEPASLEQYLTPPADVIETLPAKIARREAHLTGHSGARYARRYRKLVDRAAEAEKAVGREGLAEAVAEGYFKLMAYKDEYEVARLHVETLETELAEAFDNVGKISFHMAPPIFGKKDADGQPVKTKFGPWMFRALKVLSKLKGLRGTPLDIFGYSAERRGERKAIKDYELVANELITGLTPEKIGLAAEVARLPLKVRGFGHVKEANAGAVAKEEAALMAQFRAPGAPRAQAAE
ncbi:MAG: indolepyruvate ferredoxin oxidoreductase family protein [Pseudomonadota bacterium]